ncbi:MAG TPA: hypothetical protein VMV53_06795 [Acidimicrobiales bacterium]|nr:hypothetical protein [Acidimicrobiales bacterium]
MARRTRHPARRGLITRLFSVLLGTALAAAVMVSMQLPLLDQPASATVALTRVGSTNSAQLSWPSVGSAALFVPSLGVTRSWHNAVVPIASLTKMMTAYVTLRKLPLSAGQSGPCVTVSASDVSTYEYIKATDQSNAAVSIGENLCEIDLLNGLLVHSADNYAAMLANMVAGSMTNFVTLMNETARSLGMDSTHYADASGFDSASVSSARDQAHLAALLMQSALVRAIVLQPSVTLPVAGTLASYTPFVGTDNVIGVKSGRTSEAGGCDVMAMTFNQGSTTEVAYAVVLGQRGGDLLGPAGDAALALAQSALRLVHHVTLAKNTMVAHLGWGTHVAPVRLARDKTLWWWSSSGSLPLRVHLYHVTDAVRRGEVVGWLHVRGVRSGRVALTAGASVAAPTLWQRLR